MQFPTKAELAIQRDGADAIAFSAKPDGNRDPIARAAALSFKLSISRSTLLAIVNDAFGAASRSLARSLTVAARDA